LLIIDEPRLIVALQFGWGLDIDVKKMKEINESRHGKDYFDMTAATAVNGHTKRQNLLSHHSLSHLNLVVTEGTGLETT
jgi:hypothetical protein